MNQIIKLAANENCYGCSPLVRTAIRNKIKDVHLYPDFNLTETEIVLAEKFKVRPESIITGAGSVRIIDGIIQTFLKPSDEIITFEKSFIAYGQLAALHHHQCHYVALTDWRCEPETIFPLINKNTRLIFLANPNNPTGTIISHKSLDKFLHKLSPEIYVVSDEAYYEYVTDPTYPDTISLQKKYPNLILLRTFSKVYGLAGLRVGYTIMNEKLAIKMKNNRIPYSLNYLAGSASLAALKDQDFVTKSVKANAIERDFLYDNLNRLGYSVIPSQANFLYLYFKNQNLKEKVFQCLKSKNILVCNLDIFGQKNSLRITIGRKDSNKKIVKYLSDCR